VSDAAGGWIKIHPERWLTICARRHEIMCSPPSQADVEPSRIIAAMVFKRNWLHADHLARDSFRRFLVAFPDPLRVALDMAVIAVNAEGTGDVDGSLCTLSTVNVTR